MLANELIIVSGGSKGLGLAICERLLSSGYRVRTFSRTATLEVENLSAQYGNAGTFEWEKLDATNHDNMSAYVRNIQRKSGHIYALVNNAGINLDMLLPLTQPEEIHRVLSVNLEATILLTRLVSRNMIQGDGASIVNVSSVIGYRGVKGTSVYAATKSALLGFTHSLARELGPRNIRVNAVLPGYIETDMTAEMSTGQRGAVLRRTPLGRMGRPSDIAGVIEFLLSSSADFITGQSIVVDGGLTC